MRSLSTGPLIVLATLAALIPLALAGCVEDTPSYFPFNAGRDWSYGVTVDNAKGVALQKSFVTNLSHSDLEGEKLTTRRMHNGEVYFYKETDDGVVRVAINRPGNGLYWEAEPVHVLGYPLTPGTKWSQKEQSHLFNIKLFNAEYNEMTVPMLMEYEIESLGETVKVPAGVFTDCIKVKGLGKTSVKGNFSEVFIGLTVETVQWFAPGVGLVKSQRHETSSNPRIAGGEYVKVLEEF